MAKQKQTTELQDEEQQQPKRDWGFRHLENGNLAGTLIYGLKVGDDLFKDFEMRPAIAGDMFDAEEIASPVRVVAYRAALASVQLVRIGNIDGPIDFDLMRKMKPFDVAMLADALEEVELPGKSESKGAGNGITESSSSQ